MFKRPSKDECLDAIGLSNKRSRETGLYDLQPKTISVPVTSELVRALQPDSSAFSPVPSPGSSDWLSNHKESGQTFEEFLYSSPRVPDEKRSIIHILPLTFFENAVPSDVLEQLAHFASNFFAMPVEILHTESFTKKIENRINEYSGLVQVNAGEILVMLSKLLPSDSFCLGAITMCDLYPQESWNFVFGLANMKHRVGVYSLARYMPGFDEGIASSNAHISSGEKSALLKRACLLMCHEICHMFGLQHCIYFHCLMNGSNHFEENDKKPLRLCPVCLRKLHSSCRFKINPRYAKLAEFCHLAGMKSECEWFEKRLHHLS